MYYNITWILYYLKIKSVHLMYMSAKQAFCVTDNASTNVTANKRYYALYMKLEKTKILNKFLSLFVLLKEPFSDGSYMDIRRDPLQTNYHIHVCVVPLIITTLVHRQTEL